MILSAQDSEQGLQNVIDQLECDLDISEIAATPQKCILDEIPIREEEIKEDSFQISEISKSELNGIMGSFTPS